MIRYAPILPYLLSPNDPDANFPDVAEALREPNGLLAIGGDLSVTRLACAYRLGIFPWYGAGDPILWWSPDPRTVLFPAELHIARSLAKQLRKRQFGVTMDRDFAGVIRACAQAPRGDQSGTWLLPEMIAAYRRLHAHGLAHSVEVWRDGALVGGLYGVAIGRVFFGESMFTRIANASKIALVHLCQQLLAWDFGLIDCQVMTGHLLRMGARIIDRRAFIALVTELRDHQPKYPTAGMSWDPGRMLYPLPDMAAPP